MLLLTSNIKMLSFTQALEMEELYYGVFVVT